MQIAKFDIGSPVKFFQADGDPAQGGQIVAVLGTTDGRVDLTAWCPIAKTYLPKANVPYASAGDNDGSFWCHLYEEPTGCGE